MLVHKTKLSKCKKTELHQLFFSDHNDMKPEINNKRRTRKLHKYVEIKQYATKEPMRYRKNQNEIRKKYGDK